MAQQVQRWIEVTPSQFTHEAEGLSLVHALLPDQPPFRAWSNFEFRDSHGKWHEVDLLVLGRRRLHLVELKYYTGTLHGDDLTWRRDGHRAEDSPLKLARRKAQRLASKLKDELLRAARETHTLVADPRDVVPFVQESVFLHHPGFRCERRHPRHPPDPHRPSSTCSSSTSTADAVKPLAASGDDPGAGAEPQALAVHASLAALG